MITLVIGSAHRNSAHNADAYMARIAALRMELSSFWSIRVVAVEGDSTDNTRQALVDAAARYGLDFELNTCNHGGPNWGSTEDPARMAALSKVSNAIFDSVKDSDDVLLYIESDLLWKPTDIANLLAFYMGKSWHYQVVGPMVMAGEHFYDVWGYRDLEGNRFCPFFPFHNGLVAEGHMEVGSIGSCLVMAADVARECRIRDGNALVGWCSDARSKGHRIGVFTGATVRQV